MIVAIPKENGHLEHRVAATPGSVKDLIKSDIKVQVESQAGTRSFYSDQNYVDVGADIIHSASELFSQADVLIKVLPPSKEEVSLLKPGSILISFCQTTRDLETVKALTDRSVTGFSMHLLPRTTLAQKMDALSSQANIAGYKAVLMAATRLGVYMPLLMTAAGTTFWREQ